MRAKKSKFTRTKVNGEPTFRGAIIQVLSQNGGEMMSDALLDALTNMGLRMIAPNNKPRFKPNLWQMKNEGIIKYKPAKTPYLIKLSNDAVMSLPPNGEHAQAAPTSLPVAVSNPLARAIRKNGHGQVQPAPGDVAPVYGVAMHLIGNQVTLYVNNNRHKFSRAEFSDAADFFSLFNKRG